MCELPEITAMRVCAPCEAYSCTGLLELDCSSRRQSRCLRPPELPVTGFACCGNLYSAEVRRSSPIWAGFLVIAAGRLGRAAYASKVGHNHRMILHQIFS